MGYNSSYKPVVNWSSVWSMILIIFSISVQLRINDKADKPWAKGRFEKSSGHQCQQSSCSHTGHEATSRKKFNWTSVEVTQEAVGCPFDDWRGQEAFKRTAHRTIGLAIKCKLKYFFHVFPRGSLAWQFKHLKFWIF